LYKFQSHGIPEEVIDNVVTASKRYFALPEAVKMEISINLPISKVILLSWAKILILQGLGTSMKPLI